MDASTSFVPCFSLSSISSESFSTRRMSTSSVHFQEVDGFTDDLPQWSNSDSKGVALSYLPPLQFEHDTECPIPSSPTRSKRVFIETTIICSSVFILPSSFFWQRSAIEWCRIGAHSPAPHPGIHKNGSSPKPSLVPCHSHSMCRQ